MWRGGEESFHKENLKNKFNEYEEVWVTDKEEERNI